MAIRQEETQKTHLLDLNGEATNLVFDLNLIPNSSIIKISTSGQLLLDLNKEPCLEDDTQVEVGLHMLQETNLNTEENINEGNSNVELPQAQSHIRKLKTLSNIERQGIYETLLHKTVDGKLKKWVTKALASQFSISIRTIQRIWKQSKSSGIHADVSYKKTRNCGRKRIQIDLAKMSEIPLHQWTTLHSLSCAMNVSKTTLFRLLKSGATRRHSNAIKPYLKEENKRSRLQFCISMLDESSIPHDPNFMGMYNIIHIDEKWFYMPKKSEKYCLLPGEEDPIRTCKSKNFIGKVMLLVALAHPRFDAHENEIFSGKIGLFFFVTQEPAKRTSVNRAADTLETKPIISVKREVIRSYLIEKVLPAIKEKWPREDLGYPIYIQQDNARTHIYHNDDEFCRAATQDGFDIRLCVNLQTLRI